MVYRNNQPVKLNQEDVALIKSLYAKDATPEEFQLFMQICKSSRLDPFKKEIYFVKFRTHNGPQMVIITGIDGFRATAARDHRDFAGADAAVFTWFDPPRITDAGKRIPESATVTVKDIRGNGTTATAWWEELAPSDLKAARSDFWNRMPKVMLEKCAEAKAIRKRFPGRGNIFIREEMDQALQDVTEEGRQISVDGVAPSGAIVDQREAAKAEQRRILDEKLAHGHAPGTPQAKQAEAVLDRVEKEDARLAAAKNVTPSSGKQEATPETKTASASKKSEVGASSLAGTTLVTGNLVRCIASKASNGAEVRDVQIGNAHYKCFHKSIFRYLDQFGRMGGFSIQAFIDARKTVAGLKKIGPVYFEADGKTEKQMGREPGLD